MRRLWKKSLNQWKSLIATESLKHSPYKTFIGLVKTSIFDRYDEIGFKQASIEYLSCHYVAHQISNFCLFPPNFKWYWSVQDLILGSPPRRLNPISNPGQTNINHICQRLVLTRPINNNIRLCGSISDSAAPYCKIKINIKLQRRLGGSISKKYSSESSSQRLSDDLVFLLGAENVND